MDDTRIIAELHSWFTSYRLRPITRSELWIKITLTVPYHSQSRKRAIYSSITGEPYRDDL